MAVNPWNPPGGPEPTVGDRIASMAQRLSHATEAGFSFVLFEMPLQWGMSPGRALRILGLLLLVFAAPYWLALQTPTGCKGGIWAVWLPHRVRKDQGADTPALVTSVSWPGRPGSRHVLSCAGALWFAFWFSILSAFHIGWREWNVGTWLSRLQNPEYTLAATGWVRPVSGVQSLVSVYLVAMWFLTYFGRPFE